MIIEVLAVLSGIIIGLLYGVIIGYGIIILIVALHAVLNMINKSIRQRCAIDERWAELKI